MASLMPSNKENIESMDVEDQSMKKQGIKTNEEAPMKMQAPEQAPPHDECQYLELIQKILSTGRVKGDRTGKS